MRVLMAIITLFFHTSCSLENAYSQATDTIKLSQWTNPKNFPKEGKNEYLTKIYNNQGKLTNIFLWNRTLRISSDNKIIIEQLSYNPDTTTRYTFSI
jgi:hypothetical protein